MSDKEIQLSDKEIQLDVPNHHAFEPLPYKVFFTFISIRHY